MAEQLNNLPTFLEFLRLPVCFVIHSFIQSFSFCSYRNRIYRLCSELFRTLPPSPFFISQARPAPHLPQSADVAVPGGSLVD